MIFSFKLSYLEKVFMVYVLFSIDSITSLISVDSAPGVLLGLSSWSQLFFFSRLTRLDTYSTLNRF